MIALKKATTQDIPLLLTIEKSVAGTRIYFPIDTHDAWVKELQKCTVYLIEKDDQVTGLVSYEKKSADHVFISELAIDPRFQRQGIGREVMTIILDEIGDIRRVDLFTHPENHARKLYESLGFVYESTVENFYGDGEPRIWMAREKQS